MYAISCAFMCSTAYVKDSGDLGFVCCHEMPLVPVPLDSTSTRHGPQHSLWLGGSEGAARDLETPSIVGRHWELP